MKRLIVSMLFMVLLGAGFTACSSGGGGGGAAGGGGKKKQGSVTLTGSVDSSSGSGYTHHKGSFKSMGLGVAPATPTVDQVVALPIDRGSLSSWALESKVTSSIDIDGNFSLPLSKDYDWILVLIDSAVTGTQRYVGSIAVSAVTSTTSDGLLNLPTSVAAISSLNVGTVSRTGAGNDALTSSSVTGTDFGMNIDQITTMTKTDDLFKNAMNIVNNFENFGNPAGVWYELRPDFKWRGTYSSMTNTTILDTQPSYTYHHYNFQLDTNSTSVIMSMLCPTNTATLQLYPPTGAIVSTSNYTYTDLIPLENTSPTCSVYSDGTHSVQHATEFRATDAYHSGMTYGFPTDFKGDIPPGYWTWKENNVIMGQFDNSVVIPKTAGGLPKGYVPVLRVNADAGTHQILSVDIAWYYYDETAGTYTKLLPADMKLLSHVMRSAEVSFGNEAYNTKEDIYFDPVVTTNVVPKQTWYVYTGSNGGTIATSMMSFYETGGVGNFFEFFAL